MSWSNAIISGTLAAIAGLCGKLSGQKFLDGFWVEYAVQLVFVAAMLVLNGLMWTYYVKALQESSSLGATVATTATNFILSGLFGVIFLHETTGILWWSGIGLVMLGVVLIQYSEKKPSK